MENASIWVADLVNAVRHLHVTDAGTLDQIADILGFGRRRPPPSGPRSPDDVAVAVAESPPPATPTPSPIDVSGPRPRDVERLPQLAPRISDDGKAVPPEPLVLTTNLGYEPPVAAPLLSSLASRFIAQELVASIRGGRDPDIERLLSYLARQEIPERIPMEKRRTLARGVQVLVDRGEGMEPVAADQHAFVELLTRLVGHALVTVKSIYEVPDASEPIDPWEPPPPGTPVLALTDVGLGGRAERTQRELMTAWQAVAAAVTARGSAIVGLVPYPRNRWPTALAGHVHLVEWDRPTTAARARTARTRSLLP